MSNNHQNTGYTDEPDYTKIGEELKRLRTGLAYTQEDFAEGLGCTIAFISNVENNRSKLNLRVLLYYARLCHVSVDSILRKGLPEGGLQNESDTLDQEALSVLHQFSLDEQRKVIRMMQYYKSIQ